MHFEEVAINHGEVQATVAPSRGALVSRLQIDDKQVLYLDRTTFEDPSKNVRGGIPVLFPYAGKLENGTLKISGTQMGQHGFGRNRPWEVRGIRPGGLSVSLLRRANVHHLDLRLGGGVVHF